jgi:hypothetical protein
MALIGVLLVLGPVLASDGMVPSPEEQRYGVTRLSLEAELFDQLVEQGRLLVGPYELTVGKLEGRTMRGARLKYREAGKEINFEAERMEMRVIHRPAGPAVVLEMSRVTITNSELVGITFHNDQSTAVLPLPR